MHTPIELLTLPPLAYLASPYTKYDGGLGRAFRHAAEITGKLLTAGVHVFSPIVQSHMLALYARERIDPLDETFWNPINDRMCAACDVLLIAQLPGWRESRGVAREIEFFDRASKPSFLLDPVSFRMSRRASHLSDTIMAMEAAIGAYTGSV